MSETLVVVGSQWGDEGKGKITDYFATRADMVVRYQGGNNAGHTVMFDGNKYSLQKHPLRHFQPRDGQRDGQRHGNQSRVVVRRARQAS